MHSLGASHGLGDVLPSQNPVNSLWGSSCSSFADTLFSRIIDSSTLKARKLYPPALRQRIVGLTMGGGTIAEVLREIGRSEWTMRDRVAPVASGGRESSESQPQPRGVL